MTRTITWQKGMRLSAELFTAADEAMHDAIKQAVLSTTNGRYGLYKARSPFNLSLNITNNIVEVLALTCHAVTKSGMLINIDFDSSNSHIFDTRVAIPAVGGDETFFLVLRMYPNEWHKINETFSEAKYSFELVGEQSPIDENCLPIAAIANQYGWRMNEDNFVPPCITINAHHKYIDLWRKTVEQMTSVCRACAAGKESVAKTLLTLLWHSGKSLLIRLEKEKDLLCPESLFGIIQSFIADFNIGCVMDDNICLGNAAPYEVYANLSLNKQTIYRDIEEGLSLCSDIVLKIEAVGNMIEEESEPIPAPKNKPVISSNEEDLRRRRWTGKEI